MFCLPQRINRTQKGFLYLSVFVLRLSGAPASPAGVPISVCVPVYSLCPAPPKNMSRHSVSRVDRVAQMSAQEEIIARKKLEILEKQRTAELARQVVAAQVAASKPPSKKEKAAEKASSSYVSLFISL